MAGRPSPDTKISPPPLPPQVHATVLPFTSPVGQATAADAMAVKIEVRRGAIGRHTCMQLRHWHGAEPLRSVPPRDTLCRQATRERPLNASDSMRCKIPLPQSRDSPLPRLMGATRSPLTLTAGLAGRGRSRPRRVTSPPQCLSRRPAAATGCRRPHSGGGAREGPPFSSPVARICGGGGGGGENRAGATSPPTPAAIVTRPNEFVRATLARQAKGAEAPP